MFVAPVIARVVRLHIGVVFVCMAVMYRVIGSVMMSMSVFILVLVFLLVSFVVKVVMLAPLRLVLFMVIVLMEAIVICNVRVKHRRMQRKSCTRFKKKSVNCTASSN